MFASNGYFKGAFCPFYQHGLCHRPYCHFKHVKIPSVKESTPSTATTTTATHVSTKAKEDLKGPDSDDDVMKIVKNVPHSSEYNKKKEEEKELKKVLELIDKENREKEKTVRCYSTSSSDGEHASGLIEAFYKNKSLEIGTFTSHDDLNKGSSTNDEVTPLNGSKKRRVCECDDPDCTGFIEEDEGEVNDNNENAKTEKTHVQKPPNEDGGDIRDTLPDAKDKVRKLSDVDFFGCPTESNTTVKRKKKKKKTKASKNLEDIEEGEEDIEEEEVSKGTKRKSRKKDRPSDKSSKKRKTSDVEDDYEMVFLKGDEDIKLPTKSKSVGRKAEKPKTNAEKPKTNDYIAVDSIPTTGQGSGKKRVAHSSEEVIRMRVQPSKSKKLSYVSPGLAAPVTQNKPSTTAPVIVIPEIPAAMGFTTEQGVYVGKKRVAHNYANTTAGPVVTEKVKRPKLPMELGGKIPHLLRQRYLDKIIDELTPKCDSEKTAIEKGFAEEAVANQRSSRKQIYMNLCANIIKKVRGMPAYVPVESANSQEHQQRATPMQTGQPTVQSVNRIKSRVTSGYQKICGQNGSVKNAVKPVSSTLLNATVNNMDGRTVQSKLVQRRLSEPIELTEENFYNYLQKFVVTDGQRWENKYPRRHAEDHSLAEIKDYVPQQVNLLKRTCCRCGKEYYMNKKGKYVTREECRFHWGRLRKRREKGTLYSFYSCCDSGGDGEPCSLAILHVCERIGPLTGFVSTEGWSNDDASRKVFSLDCEMCYTTQGLELTRVTVVDFNLEQTVDLFVKPDNPIVDYNTRFSGVTKEHLKHVDTTLESIHEIFMNLFDRNTILMGHSLESDLKALKMIHHKVVDTALVFPHRLGLPFKRALRTLMGEYLQKIIQDGQGGHDSCEDARACMQLMRYKFNEDSKKFNRAHPTPQTYSSSHFYSNKT